jgi:hypothetical protein
MRPSWLVKRICWIPQVDISIAMASIEDAEKHVVAIRPATEALDRQHTDEYVRLDMAAVLLDMRKLD